jgi:hypothetical protein
MSIEIIENTEEAKENFHDMYWGSEDLIIEKEKITALLEGKTLAHEDGEYSHTFTLEKIQMSGNVEDCFTKEQMETFFNVFETIVRNQTVGSCMINGKKFIVAYGVVE